MEESDIAPLCRQKKEYKGKNRKGPGTKPTFFFLFAAMALVCFYAVLQWKVVVIADGGVKKQFVTFSKTVGDLLEEKDQQLGNYDTVTPGRDERIGNGYLIVIKRALPVTLIVGGRSQEVWTQAQTVAELLQETDSCLGAEDTVHPALDEPLTPYKTVKVSRVTRERQIEREPMLFSTVRITNSQLARGLVRVAGEGSEGVRENIIESVIRDGKEVSREVISSDVVRQPVQRVLEYGINDSFSRSGRVYKFEKAIEVSATAYCPGTLGSGCPLDERGASLCTGFNNDGYTCTGVKAVAGEGTLANPHIIAVDPLVVPLKSLVFIEGYGFARAEDTGSAIKGNSIDLLFNQHRDAHMFGRKTLNVYILSK